MVSTLSERNYLYLGIGFIGLFVFMGLALLIENPFYGKGEGSVAIAVKTTKNIYMAEVPEEKLVSRETTVFFSPIGENQNSEPIQCSINCVKQN